MLRLNVFRWLSRNESSGIIVFDLKILAIQLVVILISWSGYNVISHFTLLFTL